MPVTLARLAAPRAACLLLLGCSGAVNPDPAVPTGARGYGCPPIPTRIGPCSDFHVMNSALTCGGDGAMQVTYGTTRGGATRYVAQLMNGSRFLGSLVHWDPPCNITDGTDADFTFGAVYTGDQGEETAAGGAVTACITQSKLVFSSFNFDHVGMAPHEGFVKNGLHETFDRAVVNSVYGAEGKPPLPGRCSHWRPFRECGDGVIDAGETCDDGNRLDGDGCNAACSGG